MSNALLLPGCRERAFELGEDYERCGGLWLPPTVVEPEPTPKPIGVGLFAGAGGMDLGFTYAGFHVAAASDGWSMAACTYLVNLGGPDTVVHLVGELPEGRKRERAWHAAHTGEAVPVAEVLEVCGSSAAAGSGWISAQAGHTVEDRACGWEGKAHPDDDEKREWFHETYCLGGHDYDAQPCEHYYLGDVRELTGEQILADLQLDGDDIGAVFGGPPCQGFSISGKRQKDDPRNELVFEFMRVVIEIGPRAFCMENVPGMLNMVTRDGIPVIDALALMAEEGGMGTFDAIRRSLHETADVGAALRTKKAKSSKPRPGSTTPRDRLDIDDEDDLVEDDQLDLFAGAAA